MMSMGTGDSGKEGDVPGEEWSLGTEEEGQGLRRGWGEQGERILGRRNTREGQSHAGSTILCLSGVILCGEGKLGNLL